MSEASVATETDRKHMRRALELAERGRGHVSPNPMVGAVIVARRQRHRRGLARPARRPARRGGRARGRRAGAAPTSAGATMYVTLEPCAHQGRQPPCADAIVAAGIGRVVIGCDDPTEKASGRGPGHAARRGHRGRVHRRRRGRRGPAADPALPQARAHRPPAGRAQVGGHARRPHRDRRRRLEVDLRRGEPRERPSLARLDGRGRGRHRHRARRRPAADRPRRRRRAPARPRRLRLAAPGCRSTAASSAPRPRRR